MDYYMAILNPSLYPLSAIGINPIKPLRRLQVLCLMFLLLTINILTWAQLWYKEITIYVITDILETESVLLYSFTKCFTLITFRRYAVELIASMHRSLPLTNSDQTIQQSNHRLVNIFKYVIKFYLVLAYSTVFSFAVRPFYKELPLKCLIPSFISFEIFAFVNWMAMIGGTLIIIGADTFIMTLLLLLALQFKLLCERFQQLDLARIVDEKSARVVEKELKFIVEHHNFLLNYLSLLNKFVQFPALMQCFLTVLSVCFQLFMISQNGIANISQSSGYISYLATVSFELLMGYGVPAVYVAECASKMVWTAYNLSWTDSPYLPIRRYQIEATVSAGKIIDINLENCIRVFKTSFSFFTLLNSFA